MKIIFICTGNTCRSPMAEGYLKSKNISDIKVCSRGIFANGEPVSKNSAAVCRECNIDISAHISTPLSPEDLDADRFYCMTTSHRQILLSVGIEESKVFVLGDGIPDPFGGSIEDYRYCRDEIFARIDNLDICKILIKNAIHSDITDIAALEKECFSSPWSENAIEESMNLSTRFFVAETDGKTVGYLGVSAVADEGYITNIAVTEAYRRCGIGRMLLEKCFEMSKELSLVFISLEVRTSNTAAISLYEKMGFSAEGRRKNFYTHPTEDAIIMTRRFSK